MIIHTIPVPNSYRKLAQSLRDKGVSQKEFEDRIRTQMAVDYTTPHPFSVVICPKTWEPLLAWSDA